MVGGRTSAHWTLDAQVHRLPSLLIVLVILCPLLLLLPLHRGVADPLTLLHRGIALFLN